MEEKPAELPVSPQETQIQPPSFMDKIKVHKFKILGGVLGVLVFAGAVFGAYKIGQKQIQLAPQPTPTPVVVATPTPDPTADWKTYTSELGKFSIKYPPDWPYIKGKIYQGDITAGVLDKIHFGTDDPEADNKPDEVIVFLGVYKNSPTFGATPEEYFQKISDSVDSTTQKEIVVGGLPGVRAIVKGVYAGRDTVVVGKNGFLYRIELLESKATNIDKEGNEQTFNLMLSTFKFLEEKESVGEKVFCKDPRPQVCTMECIVNPPYICGSNGKSYCSECQACADPDIEWYVIQDTPCEAE